MSRMCSRIRCYVNAKMLNPMPPNMLPSGLVRPLLLDKIKQQTPQESTATTACFAQLKAPTNEDICWLFPSTGDTCRTSFFHCVNSTYLFDDAPDARDSTYAGALELGHLQLAVEHAAQESGVLMHLEGRPLQLQLLHDPHRGVQIQHHTGCADSPRLQLLQKL